MFPSPSGSTTYPVAHDEGIYTYGFTISKGTELIHPTFKFFGNFDSANLGYVEYVTERVHTPDVNGVRPSPYDMPDVDFRIQSKPDCFGTQFQNSNRTWFNFAVQASIPGLLVRIHLMDLNRQTKMYSQGMSPVYKIVPGKSHWERIRDKPVYTADENMFSISFKYRTPENLQSLVYFAFTYPFPYEELNAMLTDIDVRFLNIEVNAKDDIYYCRETVCLSLDGRTVDLLTISSFHNISSERETRLKSLFPNANTPRARKFVQKKVIFVSARVHPGETPSSFVFNGLLKLLLNREDVVAIALRKLYVFKMIPMLNPDGVARGHYRTDTRGVNLNRVYLNPSPTLHPPIFAARSLLRYYHYGYEKEEEPYETVEDIGREVDEDDLSSVDDHSGPSASRETNLSTKVSNLTLQEHKSGTSKSETWCSKWCRYCGIVIRDTVTEDKTETVQQSKCEHGDFVVESGIYMYIDMHGHASKKGIFMYGNHFDDMEKNIECMLLPKIMSINNYNFHFSACNFTERNMYLKDRHDGMSREGCGRVAVLKLTGLIYSYTLECNYNTGRLVNALPSTIRESGAKILHTLPVPPKYTPHTYEQVGRALAASILDLTGDNPITRLPNSQFHTLNGLRDWLRSQCHLDLGAGRYMTARFKAKTSILQTQGKSLHRGALRRTRSTSSKAPKRMAKAKHAVNVPVERKENICSKIQKNTTKIVSSSTNKLAAASIQNKSKLPPTEKNNKVKNEAETVLKDTEKLKTVKPSLPKVDAAVEKKNSDEKRNRVQLKEICFVRGTEGKRVIAKYNTKNSKKGSQDNLVVSWDNTNNPQVFSYRTRGPGIQDLKPLPSPAGPSKGGCFRVHNFAKSATKMKKIKRPLRRLTTTIDAPTKSEPLKKRRVFKRGSSS